MAQFRVALRSRRSGPVPGWNATPNGAVSRLFDAYGMTPRRRARAAPARGPSARGRAPKNMESTTMQSAAKSSRMARRSRHWPGQRADEDPAQVVLDPAHAALGRRLALGVGHHQIVGVVRRGEGDEASARGLDRFPVVLGREEDHVVAFARPGGRTTRPGAGGMALRRRGAEDEAPPGRTVVAGTVAAHAPPTRSWRADDRPAPGRQRQRALDARALQAVLGAHGHRPGHAVEGRPCRLDMLSSTVAPSPRA